MWERTEPQTVSAAVDDPAETGCAGVQRTSGAETRRAIRPGIGAAANDSAREPVLLQASDGCRGPRFKYQTALYQPCVEHAASVDRAGCPCQRGSRRGITLENWPVVFCEFTGTSHAIDVLNDFSRKQLESGSCSTEARGAHLGCPNFILGQREQATQSTEKHARQLFNCYGYALDSIAGPGAESSAVLREISRGIKPHGVINLFAEPTSSGVAGYCEYELR